MAVGRGGWTFALSDLPGVRWRRTLDPDDARVIAYTQPEGPTMRVNPRDARQVYSLIMRLIRLLHKAGPDGSG
jgi:hypothetical protein